MPQARAGAGPGEGEVGLWLLDPGAADARCLQACEQALAPDERERAARFLAEDARRQFVLARSLLRYALSCCARVPRGEWTFGANGHGKPHVVRPAEAASLCFNVSHTHGLVACAVARELPLGVDVERCDRRADLAGLANQLFAASERARFEALPAADARDYFFSIWTLKEAYVKALGVGLSHPLASVAFELDGASAARCSDTGTPWQFLRLQPTAAHKLALAVPAARSPRLALAWVPPVALTV